MTTQHAPGSGDGPALARRGMLWFALGAAVIITTHLLRVWAPGPLARYGPFIPMVAGAYALVLGVEKMVSGVRRAPRPAGPTLAACVCLVAAVAVAGGAVYLRRAPYWRSISAWQGGGAAASKLQAIAERHAANMQSGATGAAAIDSWRRSAQAAVPLRPEFAAALDAARYLAASGGGLRAQADIDVKFYTLCLEWMDLYDRVRRTMSEVSLDEPPPEWAVAQDDIITRIQALPAHPQEGS